MDDSDNMSTEDSKSVDNISIVKKPKKRSLVERELETNLTARITSPVTNAESTSLSRYGRVRRLKTEMESMDLKKVESPKLPEKSPMKVQSPVYKMHASNTPIKAESPKNPQKEMCLENQIENIYQENISLSRFASEEIVLTSPLKKMPKVYIQKDLIQRKDTDDPIMLIKHMFSPEKSSNKLNSHLNDILEQSERFNINMSKQNGCSVDNSSVVKTLDFDSKKKKKENKEKALSKNELFELEAKCMYQVGDLAWARMGTYPFWPCITTRDPESGMFVRKKLFGRVEHDIIHVTFFGDNGRHSWIVDNMLRNYTGLAEFESTREQFTTEDKKRDPRLYAAFFISEKKQVLWKKSVDEAETLYREPKRLRIDLFNDMLQRSRALKTTPKLQKKVTRTNSDVSLSESLYDSLFSEDDGKVDDTERSKNKSRNKSLDVSEVVTACLDNMAAKTGITKIQKQSHMDRWLQKAKSQTPEKVHVKTQVIKVIKINSNKKWKIMPKDLLKPYSLRRSGNESLTLLFNQNEHDYSKVTPDILKEQIEKSNVDNVETASDLKSIIKVNTEKSNNLLCNDVSLSKPSNVDFGSTIEINLNEENNRVQADNYTGMEVFEANKNNSTSLNETYLELNTKLSNGSPKFIEDENIEDLYTQTNPQTYLPSNIVPKNTYQKFEMEPGTNEQSVVTNTITEANTFQPTMEHLNHNNNLKSVSSSSCVENEPIKNIEIDAKMENIDINGPVSHLTGNNSIGNCNVSDINSVSIHKVPSFKKAGPYSQDPEINLISAVTNLNESAESCILNENLADDGNKVKKNLTEKVTDVKTDVANVDSDINKKIGICKLKDESSLVVNNNLNDVNNLVTDSIDHISNKKVNAIHPNTIAEIETTTTTVENSIALGQSVVTIKTVDEENKTNLGAKITDKHTGTVPDLDKECLLNNDTTILENNEDSLENIHECDANDIKLDTSNTVTNIEDIKLYACNQLMNDYDVKETMALEKHNGFICDTVEKNKETKVGTYNFNIENKCIVNQDIYSNSKSKADNFIFLDKSTDKCVNLEAEKNTDSSILKNSSYKKVPKNHLNCNQKNNLLISDNEEDDNSIMSIDENYETEKETTINFDVMVKVEKTDETEVQECYVNSNHNKEINKQLQINIDQDALLINDIDYIQNKDKSYECRNNTAETKNNNIQNSALSSPNISEKDDSERNMIPLLDINITDSLNKSVGTSNFLNSLKSLELAICNDIAELDMPFKESAKIILITPQNNCDSMEKNSETQRTLIHTEMNKHDKEKKTQVLLENNGFKENAELFEYHANINIRNKETKHQYDCKSKINIKDCEAKDDEKKEITNINNSSNNLVDNDKVNHGTNIFESETDKVEPQKEVDEYKEIMNEIELNVIKVVNRNAIELSTQNNLVNRCKVDVKNSTYESETDALQLQIKDDENKEIVINESTFNEVVERNSMELQNLNTLVNKYKVDLNNAIYESEAGNQQLQIKGDVNKKIDINQSTFNEDVERNSKELQTQSNLVDKYRVDLKNGIYENESYRLQLQIKIDESKELTNANKSVVNELAESKPIELEIPNKLIDKYTVNRENSTHGSEADKLQSQIKVDDTNVIINASEPTVYELIETKSMQLETQNNLIESNTTDHVNSFYRSEKIQSQNMDDENKSKIITNISDEKTTNEHVSGVEADRIIPELKCHNKLTQNVKESHYIENGYHDSESLDLRDSDDDFDIDAVSVNSEDSAVSLNKTDKYYKRKLRAKPDTPLEDPEFLRYLEMRQDSLIDENPGLTDDEIISYLYKTYLYEESQKSDFRKTDDIEQSSLVKGLNDSKIKKNRVSKSVRESFFQKKKKKIIKNVIHEEIDDISITSDSDVSLSNKVVNGSELVVTMLDKVNSKGDRIMKITKVNKDVIKPTINNTSIISETKQTSLTDFIDMKKLSSEQKADEVNILESIKEDKNMKDLDSETASIGSEDMDVPLIFRKVRTKVKENDCNGKDSISTIKNDDTVIDPKRKDVFAKRKKIKSEDKINFMENPEFLQYLELRQDVLIEENPQLRQEEIVQYLYKTWIFEEEKKSEQKKADELEQSGLVKGLKQVTEKQLKNKKKHTSDKNDCDDIQREKPRRKASKPFYNEEYTDLEDELEVFEIFKQKPLKVGATLKEEFDNSDTTVKTESEAQEIESEAIQDENEVWADEVEFYFEQLTKPKPNIFKGLIREKVCEVCETVNNLIKCKSCHGMFHIECIKKVEKDVKADAPSRGRKKKRGRKPKSLEDSESQSDEKCLDISEEHNVSIEEYETEPYTVDANVFENELSIKMKEVLDNLEIINYDSYSSDDGIDWIDTVPGRCEIVDIKLKKREKPVDYSNFKCNNCEKYDTPVCFVCKLAISKTGNDFRQKCNIAHCNKYYHVECLNHWPQTQFNAGEVSRNNKKMSDNKYLETLTCPRHVCHTCVSDDPRGCKTRFSGDKLARCVRCPATYHSFTKCLPAGSKILTGSNVICPRHYEHRPGKVPCHVNTGWCFICALGGTLICCEYCPTSFHAECLNIDPPEGGYMCEDCETGRLPLYGEMVWVKLGNYRWWPGLILHPSEVPENLLSVRHSLGEFVVRFFGQYDYYWVNRGRVFPFQEGDSGRVSSQKSKIDAAFTTAMEHAQRACEIMKLAQPNEEESLDIASSLLPPHYVKLKTNKPVGSVCLKKVDDPELSLTQCECDPNEEDPCGPYSQCLNRMLLTECGPTCRAGDRCNNRAFEKRLYPKLTPYRTHHRGWGLKTLEDIKAGQFVIEYVGELIDEEEFQRRMRRKHEIRDENYYFLTLDKERMIDAGPKGNLARFMNHCCEPNCETQKWTVLGDVRVGLFAIHDIPANSEVTFNYNLECAGIEKKKCLCGTKRCSGFMGAKPKQDESQSKKNKLQKRTYKKRKQEESPPVPKKRLGRPRKNKELTEIEKDLLIIKSATFLSSDDSDFVDKPKSLKRKRMSFSSDDKVCDSDNVNIKRSKTDVGD